MRVLVIIVYSVLLSFGLYSQTKNQLVQFADENYAEGDFYGASLYYQKALAIDSVDIDLLFKYAEALRQYNNYQEAEHYYQKVYDKGNGRIHPTCLFWLATMKKHNGEYKEASKLWKRVKTVTRDKKSYEYLKAQQEIKSCTFAARVSKYRSDITVKNSGDGINTFDSEFSPILNQDKLYFSSLRANKMIGDQQVEDPLYTIKIYRAEEKDSVWYLEQAMPKTINNDIDHNGNGTFSPNSEVFYFTRCKTFDRCEIFYTSKKGDSWSEPKPININSSNATTTQPMIGLVNGKETLFFSSDREGGEGKLDIWYATKKADGVFDSPINAGDKINSLDNEITPFFSAKENSLYFSSNWHYGLGGFDVYKASLKGNSFDKPENVLLPINSSANDFYYIEDTLNYKGYFASNRVGSMFYKSPTCCNDIYEVTYPKPIVPEEIQITTLEDLNKYLPVKLYFHNDCPNPKTTDTVTNLNYLTTYVDYKELVPIYQEEYSKGLEEDKAVEAVLDINDFFKSYVDKGVSDLALFTKLLLIELQKGTRINLTVRGFASPLAKTDYNVKLTGRRISSLINYLKEFEGGVFKPFISSNQLTFTRIPFGEYTADQLVSDNLNDKRNSVYSRAAGLERKIEIVSINLIADKERIGEAKTEEEIYDFGKIKSLDTLKHTFTITNIGSAPLKIQNIETSCGCTAAKPSKTSLEANETATIEVAIKPSLFRGKQMQVVTIETDGNPKKIDFSLTFELE